MNGKSITIYISDYSTADTMIQAKKQVFLIANVAASGEQGFEPRLTDPESVVLPLHYSPKPNYYNFSLTLHPISRQCKKILNDITAPRSILLSLCQSGFYRTLVLPAEETVGIIPFFRLIQIEAAKPPTGFIIFNRT